MPKEKKVASSTPYDPIAEGVLPRIDQVFQHINVLGRQYGRRSSFSVFHP